MATLANYQSQFKAALLLAPDFLVFNGVFSYTVEGSTYDPVTDTYTGTTEINVSLKCLRGQEVVGGQNTVTFLTETEPFKGVAPSVNSTLLVGGETWNIQSVSKDPIGLTYTFTVESKDGI